MKWMKELLYLKRRQTYYFICHNTTCLSNCTKSNYFKLSYRDGESTQI